MRAIHQVLPAFVGGDAIGNFARQIQRSLHTLGFESRIYAASVEPDKRGRALRMGDHFGDARRDSGIIYHHSIGSSLVEYVTRWPGPRLMIYHNITPGWLLRAHNARFADLLDAGRRALPTLAKAFSFAVGVSEFNRADLVDAGFGRTAVLPIPLDAAFVRRTPRHDVWGSNGSGDNEGLRLVFVGRMMPHKCPHLLVEWFDHFLRGAERLARLVLVGGVDDRFEQYNRDLVGRVRALGGAVRLAGRVSDEELTNWYRWADAFVSFSEHEGFMVPLLEAMAHETVVVARRIPAVSETLGRSGVQFEQMDFDGISATVSAVLGDASIREGLLRGQSSRLEYFSPERFRVRLARVMESWLEIGW